MHNRILFAFLVILTAVALLPSGDALAQAAGEPPPSTTESPQGFFSILASGGIVGLLIVLLSIGGVALVVEHVMTIRRAVLVPPEVTADVRDLLTAGHLAPAIERCRSQPSLLSRVLSAGLGEIDGGWTAVEKAMEDATAEQSARLYRKVEYLSVIGNIAPMLGLLGTVMGMIYAFREVANTQGAARAADLAEGIYLALVTTVEGLVVAIPSLAAFAFFRNRVDQLVAEAAYAAQHAVAPVKRARSQRSAARKSPQPPPAPGE